MSILDSITAAEAAAAEVKRDAQNRARDLAVSAEEEAREKADAMVKQAREQAKALLAKAEKEADQKSADELALRSAEDAAMAQKARANLPAAASHIVERIEKR